jgi:hypothetical protein
LLFSDTLALEKSNDPDAMQVMLNRLDWYAQRKHLIINTAKSEVVHFNSSGSNVPVFKDGRVPLVHRDSFEYLGMTFYRRMSMIKSSKHAAGPFMASAFRVRQFVRESSLVRE